MRKIFFIFLLFLPITCLGQEKILPVDIKADEISYFQEETKAIATGNVKITYKDVELFCDRAEYDANKNIAHISGNVKIVRKDTIVYGKSIVYDFNTNNAEMTSINLESSPLYGAASKANKIEEEKYILNNGYITTCNLKNPHYRLTAKHIIVFPKVKVVAKNMFLKVGSIPIFYFPYISIPLKDKSFPLQLSPGKNNKWGNYVLTRWRYHIDDKNRGKVHLDYYEERGIGGGITHKTENKNFGEALINYYNIQDKLYKLSLRDKLLSKYPERKILEEKYLKDDRYRGSVYYSWQPFKNLSIKSEFNKFSDENFMKDFFYREYEKEPHPLSYILIDYSLNNSSLSLFTQKRFNPFFTEVEYLPQLQYNFYRRNIGSSNFYFESKSTIGNLAYRYGYSNKEIDTFRLHSHNILSYTDNIKWLCINPYVGSYSTFYSRSPIEKENVFRYAPEVGLNLSTKLYKYLDIDSNKLLGIEIDQLRHILTPKIAYNYIFPPTVSQNQIFQFDSLDALSREQKIVFTLDNKLQTKNDEKIWDFIYFSPSVEYNLKKDGKGSYFDKIISNLEIYPNEYISFKQETNYDFQDRAINTMNVDFTTTEPVKKKYAFSLGHRYLRNESSQLTSNLTYQLTTKLQFKNYLRYEYKDKKFKEQEYVVRADLHCWWLDLGLNIDRDKNFSLWFAFVLKDFPDIHIGFDHTYQGARKSY